MNALSRFGKAALAGFRESARMGRVLAQQARIEAVQRYAERYNANGTPKARVKAKGSK